MSDLYWYRDAVIYELHVRSFHDSNADGTGDFVGLIRKLDYLADLGVTAIWLLPFYPSPLRDDGYDIADYYGIHPAYGTMEDFKLLLEEAHARGIRVITELVINHTSDQHDWFKRSRRAAPGSFWRDFYVWSEQPEKYGEARIIFKDFEPSNWTWDPEANAYYWHRFYSHQPDLNFDNPNVEKAIFEVLDYWLGMGVDGLRLDAVPYLFEREHTSCENLPETHSFLKRLRKHVDEKYPGRMLLAEANQWPEDAVGYFGNGDECHMCFHFPLMPRLFMAIRMEDRYSIVDILKQTPEIPENCQWATFLRNHDELTLEMVTDEERDYMYHVYASDPKAAINLGIRRRLAPLVENDRRQIELLNGLLFSLPGTPVIYYGDEIGMGDNIHLGDRNGVRTPFQWSVDRNAGFSAADPQSLYLPLISTPEYHYGALNVETDQKNPNSLLWWMKRLISVRKAYPEFSTGKIEFVTSENSKVVSYLRRGKRALLVVANLSRSVQCVELSLSEFQGFTPVELFGMSKFPPIGDRPFFLTLPPNAFYWFELKEAEAEDGLIRPSSFCLEKGFSAASLRKKSVWGDFEPAIRRYLPTARWFLGKERAISGCSLADVIEIGENPGPTSILIIQVNYREGPSENYVLPVTSLTGAERPAAVQKQPQCIIAEARDGNGETSGIIFESVVLPEFAGELANLAFGRGGRGAIGATAYGELPADFRLLECRPLGLDQSNSSFVFGQEFFLKLYRRLDSGENPEIRIGRHFAAGTPFPNAAKFLGTLDYRTGFKKYSLGCLQAFVESHGDAWTVFLSSLSTLAERATATLDDPFVGSRGRGGLIDSLDEPVPEMLGEVAGTSFNLAQLLGRRTGEMHLALVDSRDDPEFAAEPFTPFYQRSLYQSFRNATIRNLDLLEKSLPRLPDSARTLAADLLTRRDHIFERFSWVKSRIIRASREITHGDFHLGQAVFTGKDFVIIDFEGEPRRTVSERRLKRCPLRDVAGMLRSFDYLAAIFLKEKVPRPEDRQKISNFIEGWRHWVSVEFLKGYFKATGQAGLFPKDPHELQALLDLYRLDKALYELGYELGARPDWVFIPLRGILGILEEKGEAHDFPAA